MLSCAPTASPTIQALSVEKLIAAVRGHRDAAAAAKLNTDHVPFIIQRPGVCVCVWILFCLWTIEPSHPTSLN